MKFSAITALSPLDGRYSSKTKILQNYFSEFALIQHRVCVEIAWLKALSDEPEIAEVASFTAKTKAQLDELVSNFSVADAEAVKTIEGTTNHDVKAVEYWLKQVFASNAEITQVTEFIHFACTSEDINNLAYNLMLKSSLEQVMLPALDAVINRLAELAQQLADLSMLSRTHGQPASPTTMGKELANVVFRLHHGKNGFLPLCY